MTNGPTQPHPLTWPYGCPYCGSPVPFGTTDCGICSLPLQDVRAARIWSIDSTVVGDAARRELLLAERHRLLAAHERALAAGSPSSSAAAPPAPPVPPPPAATATPPGPQGRRFEVRFRDAQTALLALGGLLVALAALVFAVVTWRTSSPAVRAGLLVTLTGVAAYAPVPLRRRGLRDTAETIGALAMALLSVDVLLVRHLVADGVDSRSFWAAATGILAVAYLSYGHVVRLVGPRLIAVAAAQLPILLLAARIAHSEGTASWFLLVAVTLDGLIWFLSRRMENSLTRTVMSAVALTAAAGLWGVGLLMALADLAVRWGSTPAVLADCGSLAVFAAIAVVAGVLSPQLRDAAAAISGGLGASAVFLAVVNVSHAGQGLTIATCLALTAVLALVVAAAIPATWRTGLLAAAALGLAAAAAEVLPLLSVATKAELRGTTVLALPVSLASSLLLVIAAVTAGAVALATMVTGWPSWWRLAVAAAGSGFIAALPLVVAVSSMSLAAATLAVSAALVALAIRAPQPGAFRVETWAIGLALASYAPLVSRGWLPGLSGALAGVAVLAAVSAARGLVPELGASLAVVSSAAAAFAGWAATGSALPPGFGALAVVAGVGGGLVLADRRGLDPHNPTTQAVEASVTGVAAAVALAMLVPDGAGWFAWALSVIGVTTAAQSMRPARRAAAYPGLALISLSSWIHLAAHDVTLVEAYSLPVSLLVIAVGLVRRRRDETVSSWSAYGTGLVGALVPSLAAGLSVGPSTRSALVLVAAAGVALIGARSRLSAPLLIGASVALADALWLGLPALAAVPRWASLGTVGAILLFVGATYEQRRREAQALAHHVRALS